MAKFTMPDMHNAARLHTTTFHPKSRSNNSRKAILSRKAPVADRLYSRYLRAKAACVQRRTLSPQMKYHAQR